MMTNEPTTRQLNTRNTMVKAIESTCKLIGKQLLHHIVKLLNATEIKRDDIQALSIP